MIVVHDEWSWMPPAKRAALDAILKDRLGAEEDSEEGKRSTRSAFGGPDISGLWEQKPPLKEN